MRRLLLSVMVVVLAVGTTLAHDLFLRPDSFRVAPGGVVAVKVFNGTFSRSENAVTRDRLADLSVVSVSGRRALDRAVWTEREPQSTLEVTLGEAGTHVLGAALHPRLLKLAGRRSTPI